MSRAKVKFKISLKELSLEFEGDKETAQEVHQRFARSLGEIQSAQTAALGDGRTEEAPTVIDVQPTRRRRAKRKIKEPSDSPKTNGNGPTKMIELLCSEGFFDEPRLAGDVEKKLAERGHNVKAKSLAVVLKRLTQRNTLRRSQDPTKKQWKYTSVAGAADA